MLSVSGSSGTRSEMSNASSIDSTSIIDDLLGIVAQVHDQMETGMEDNTIQWGERLLIQDLSEDDALMHFCFGKAHLQEVADKLWPRLQCFLSGHRGSIKVNYGTYSLPYENFLLFLHYRLSMPRRIRNGNGGLLWTPQVQNINWDHMYDSCHAWIGIAVPWQPYYISSQDAILCRESLSKMWIGWNCMGIHWWNTLQNMSSKLVSKTHVQWSQKVSWNQVLVSSYTRWLICIHVWSSKLKQAWFISPF